MNKVAIVGAGITGLVAGYYLKKIGIPVQVFESSNRVGGVIRTIWQNGFLAECGPNSILETDPRIRQLTRDLGIDEQIIYSAPQASKRFVVRDGIPVPLPGSALEFLKTPLFSTSAKLRLLREPFISRGPAEAEESLAAFVVRRLGREFLDYAINPFVAGVYAGNPWKLSLREAFPKLWALEQRYGSLIGGQILGARERKKRKTVSKQNAPKFSFPLGLEYLTQKIGEELAPELNLQHSLKSLVQREGGWEVGFENPAGRQTSEFSAVLLAAPSFKLADIEFVSEKGNLDFLREILYAPVSTLVLGFHRNEVEHSLDGFGFLVPEVERMKILGAIFSSSLFPGRAPQEHVLITTYLGGLRAPELPFQSFEQQRECAMEDLEQLLGVKGKPVFTSHAVYPKAIPQYEVGFGAIRARMAELEGNCHGLYLAGNWRDGISLSDSILSGCNIAERISHEQERWEPRLAHPVAA